MEVLLTQAEGRERRGGWRDEWRSGERMHAMWREGETDNEYRTLQAGAGWVRVLWTVRQGDHELGRTHTHKQPGKNGERRDSFNHRSLRSRHH